jgi:hypothetical protein
VVIENRKQRKRTWWRIGIGIGTGRTVRYGYRTTVCTVLHIPQYLVKPGIRVTIVKVSVSHVSSTSGRRHF